MSRREKSKSPRSPKISDFCGERPRSAESLSTGYARNSVYTAEPVYKVTLARPQRTAEDAHPPNAWSETNRPGADRPETGTGDTCDSDRNVPETVAAGGSLLVDRDRVELRRQLAGDLGGDGDNERASDDADRPDRQHAADEADEV